LSKNQSDDLELTKLIRLLNIESVKKLKTNPRLRITLPAENARMVFGFNNWENGSRNEYLENSFFSEILKTTEFTEGPKKDLWPVKKFTSQSTIFSPFAPGINSFEYYFIDSADKKILTPINSFSRSFDIVEDAQQVKIPGAFLVYSAYTQRVGKKAERYTGINITNLNSTPSFDYFELEFNQLVKWQNL
jgi:hypothetical protein